MITDEMLATPLPSWRLGAVDVAERPRNVFEQLMGYGSCRRCQQCFGFVAPNAGPASQCSNCGHEFAVHW